MENSTTVKKVTGQFIVGKIIKTKKIMSTSFLKVQISVEKSHKFMTRNNWKNC